MEKGVHLWYCHNIEQETNFFANDNMETMNHHHHHSALRLAVYWLTVVAGLWTMAFFYAYGTDKGRKWYREDLAAEVSFQECMYSFVFINLTTSEPFDRPYRHTSILVKERVPTWSMWLPRSFSWLRWRCWY